MVPESKEHFDVIVAGGGPAGLGAALASSVTGAKTLLLEGRSFFGGIAALSMWMPFNRLMVDGGSRGGVHDMLVKKLKSYGADAYSEGRCHNADKDGLDIHPDYLRLAAFELLEENGCHYKLYSQVTEVMKEGNKVIGVASHGKKGKNEYYAKIIIDATGDGDVAYFAGAEYMEGREADGMHMSAANPFSLMNVDVDKATDLWMNHGDDFMKTLKKAREEGYCTASWHSFDKSSIPGVVSTNNGGAFGIGNIDGTSEKDLTVVERFGAKIAVDFVTLARDKKLPGFENCYLMRNGYGASVRDTRRIVGEYILTEDDAREGIKFDDTVCRKYGFIDAPGIEIEDLHIKPQYVNYPYRSLIVKATDNLLVAGRCGSATFVGHAAGKSMGNMMGLGQAAGVAAAICIQKDITLRQLDAKEIQTVLRGMNVAL